MATTTFTNYSTVIDASWLNDVDALVWDVFGGATTDAAAIAALGLDADLPTFSVPANTTISSYIAGILDDADEATLKASINLEIGTDVQAYDADLAAIAALAHTKGNVVMSNGSAWVSAPVHGRKNKIINGNFDIWQRNTTQTISGYGSADRWAFGNSGTTKTVSRQAFTVGQTAVPGEPKYFCRQVVSSVAGATNYCIHEQRVESVRTFAGQTCTYSFWAKADAAKNIAVEFVQQFGTGGSPSAPVTAIGVATCALTTSWQKFTVTATLPSISGKTIGTNNDDHLACIIWLDAGSDHNARTNSLGQQSGTFDIAQAQLEGGAVATSFENRPLAEEIILCQRYYEKSYNLDVIPGTVTTVGAFASFSLSTYSMYRAGFTFQVRKRVSPSISPYNHQTGAIGTWYFVNAAASYIVYPVSQCEVGWEPSGNGGWPGGDYTYPQWTASAEL